MFHSIGRDNRILMLSLALWALGEGLWFNLRPIYVEQLGATPSQVGLVLAIEGIARVIVLIPGGWLSDRYSQRGLLLASWLMGIPAILLMALAPDWRWMIPAEILYGISLFVSPALSSYVLLAAPRREEGRGFERMLTTVYASYSAGLIFSQPLGGLIADRYGIRSTFWITVFLFAISTVVLSRIRHYTVPREAATGDWRTLVHDRSFLTLAVFSFLVVLSIALGWPLAPIFLHTVRGFSLSAIGLFASVFSVGTVVWNLTLGRIRPRWGLASILGLVWLSMLILLQSGAVLAVGFAYLMLGAIYTTRSLLNAAVARRVTLAQRGMAFAINEVSMSLAYALSPRIAGALYEVRPGLPFIASLASIPLAAVSSLVLLSVLRRPAVQAVPVTDDFLAVPSAEGDA